ncbi:hypothetical protein BJX96DRAFT_127374 [Aspergillus floccosus]
MAPDKKDKKRKAAAAAAASDSPAKKTKKVDAKPVESPKPAAKPAAKKGKDKTAKAEEKPAPNVKVNGEPARQTKPRKRAADFLSDDEEGEPEVNVKEFKADAEKKSSNKKSKKEDGTAVPAPKAKAPKLQSISKANTKGKKAQAAAEESDEAPANGASESEDEGFDPDQPVPKIPDSKKLKRKILKKQKEHKTDSEQPGVVYVGRIPHGFYEHQMRAYFSQFGDITRLRLSRNRITGRSKHYAFIEFASTSVAKIVAATMDNYLMYGHILKCKYVPQEQLHPEIWKGANRRFKRTPWNRIEKKRLDKGKTREQWTERIEREQKRRLAKAEKLKALGYEFEMPQLKSVDDVPVQEESKAIEAGQDAPAEEAPKAIEAPEEPKETKDAEDTPKKSKKEKKAGSEKGTPKQPTPKKGASEVTASPATKAGAKAKKAGKGKK